MRRTQLRNCPTGLFLFGDNCLGMKTEYKTRNAADFYQTDAYVVESGEYFWGGAKTAEAREKLLVTPIVWRPAPSLDQDRAG
jgi:hypothetical protein